MGIRDLLGLLPKHERERQRQAAEAQRELLQFYALAHVDISNLMRFHLNRLQGPLSKPAVLQLLRSREVFYSIANRISILNTQVDATLRSTVPKISNLVSDQITAEASALGMTNIDPITPDHRVIESKLNYAIRKIGSWNKNLHKDIVRTIRMGLLKGEDYRQLAERVAATHHAPGGTAPIAQARAHMLANTRFAVVSASNAARQDAYKQVTANTGLGVRKMWWASISDCCINCAKLHGLIVNLGDDFPWQTLGLTYPPFQGRLPHPPYHPNCRCRLIPVTDDVLTPLFVSQVQETKTRRLTALRKVA